MAKCWRLASRAFSSSQQTSPYGLFGLKDLQSPEDWGKLSARALERYPHYHSNVSIGFREYRTATSRIVLEFLKHRCKELTETVSRASPSVETIKYMDDISDTVI